MSEGQQRQDLGVAKGFRTISTVIRARKTRQLVFFPLATPTVGWVLDRTPEAEASAADSERSGELCGRAAD